MGFGALRGELRHSFRNSGRKCKSEMSSKKRSASNSCWGNDGGHVTPANELSRPRHDNTVLKALARAFRWKRMLEEGSYASITELAEKEKIGMSYLTRVVRMTLLAPDIIDAILEGRQGDGIDLTVLAAPFPTEWGAQRRHFGFPSIDGLPLTDLATYQGEAVQICMVKEL